jgi:hypothetical protein
MFRLPTRVEPQKNKNEPFESLRYVPRTVVHSFGTGEGETVAMFAYQLDWISLSEACCNEEN